MYIYVYLGLGHTRSFTAEKKHGVLCRIESRPYIEETCQTHECVICHTYSPGTELEHRVSC